MADRARIEELRRRVDDDPGSIAFAQLAEEHRRAGDLQDAIRVARAGLAIHPDYHSARVTLGRALASLGKVDEAGVEFLAVLQSVPGHAAAARALADFDRGAPAASVRKDPPGSRNIERTLAALQGFLDAIHASRTQRRP
jgi:tetratricopeptide (TPR) repeat protein